MEQDLIVKGRLVGPKTVELDQPIPGAPCDVEVVVHLQSSTASNGGQSVFDFLRSLPGGARSKAEIDRQVREERDSWGTE